MWDAGNFDIVPGIKMHFNYCSQTLDKPVCQEFSSTNPFDSLHIMHGLDTADTMAMWDYHLFYSLFLWLSRPSRWCSFLSESEYDDDDDMSKNFPQISKKHLIFVDVSSYFLFVQMTFGRSGRSGCKVSFT